MQVIDIFDHPAVLGPRDDEAALFDSVKLPLYGADDGAALRDLLFTWWEERYLGATAGAPAVGAKPARTSR